MERSVLCPYCFKEHNLTVVGSFNGAVKLLGNCANGRQAVLYFNTSNGKLYYPAVYQSGNFAFSPEHICRSPKPKKRNRPKDDNFSGVPSPDISLQMVNEETGEYIPV